MQTSSFPLVSVFRCTYQPTNELGDLLCYKSRSCFKYVWMSVSVFAPQPLRDTCTTCLLFRCFSFTANWYKIYILNQLSMIPSRIYLHISIFYICRRHTWFYFRAHRRFSEKYQQLIWCSKTLLSYNTTCMLWRLLLKKYKAKVIEKPFFSKEFISKTCVKIDVILSTDWQHKVEQYSQCNNW